MGVLAETIDDTETDIKTNKTVAKHDPVHSQIEFPFILGCLLRVDAEWEDWYCQSQEGWFSSDFSGWVFVYVGEKNGLGFEDDTVVA
jgi:hypothetical protein